jgi:hypothetical protein
MARGQSGRIVLEINPLQKGELYSALTRDGLTLRGWFLQQVDEYLRDRNQLPLFQTPTVGKQRGPTDNERPKASRRIKSK